MDRASKTKVLLWSGIVVGAFFILMLSWDMLFLGTEISGKCNDTIK